MAQPLVHQAAVHFKAMVLLLFLIPLLLPLFVGLCVWSLFFYVALNVFYSFAIILMGKRGLVALLCLMTVSVLWLFLVGLQCVSVVFLDYYLMLMVLVGRQCLTQYQLNIWKLC